MLGVPKVKNARDLDDYIVLLQQVAALERPRIMPAVWPFRPYARDPLQTDLCLAYDDDQG